jgi:hypothetical protein
MFLPPPIYSGGLFSGRLNCKKRGCQQRLITARDPQRQQLNVPGLGYDSLEIKHYKYHYEERKVHLLCH